MARSVNTDFLQSFRFHVTASASLVLGGLEARFLSRGNTLGDVPKAEAGFSAVNTPSGTIDAAEYREGHYVYTRKYPGIPTMDDITMSRGCALKDTAFYFWFKTCIEGDGEYRADLTVHHFARQTTLAQSDTTLVGSPEGINAESAAKKLYTAYEAFPTAHKVATDLDSTASEVSIMDLTVAYERFTVETNAEFVTV